MKMKRLLCAGMLLLCACAPRYGVSTLRDDFEGTEIRRMRGNVLGGGGGEWIALGAEARRVAGDSVRYALILDYRATDDWLRIGPGETLILLVDGERMPLEGTGSGKSRRRGPLGFREQARYAIGADQLRKLADARTARVRVLGRRYYVERDFTPGNLRRFRDFLHPPDPAAPPDGRADPGSGGTA